MGRMLDSLRQKDAPAVDLATEDEVTPYIEVGGPGKQVELSPCLIIAHPAQPKVQPPHGPVERKPLVVNLTEAAPMAVAFEPWPGPPALHRVAPEVIAFHRPDHPVSREYAALLGKMLDRQPTADGLIVLLTGLRPHVGATTVLLNLAVVAAAGGRRTAVVDAHPTRPDLAARLGHTGQAGLQDVIAGRLALEQAVVPTAVPNLRLLPARLRDGATGPLSDGAAGWLLAWLRERFDVVLLDGPALDDPAALATLAPRCDDLYLVLPEGETAAVNRGPAQTLARMGGRLRGLIHTHFAA